MSQTVASGCEEKAHIANHYVAASISGAVRQGHNGRQLLSQAGIDESWLYRPGQRLTETQLARLIKAVWRATDDEFMALAPSRCPRGVFALMAEFAFRGETLGGMLSRCARFYSTVYDSLTVRLDDDSLQDSGGGQVFFALHLQHDRNDPDHMLQEFLLLMWQRFTSWLVGQQIPFASTAFSYPAPPHAGEYRVMFSGELLYTQPACGFTLHSRLLQLPIIRTEAELAEFVAATPGIILHRPVGDQSLQQRVRHALQFHDPGQMPSLDDIARVMHMAPRTLRRKLKEEGGSLRRLKEERLHRFAVKLLITERYSIQDIASRLGFSETAAFCRAFKRWTGVSPSGWRAGQAGARR